MSIIYRDLDLNFMLNPISNDVSMLNNENAVKRSIRNLILSHKYEKHFHPEISSKISGLLFEPPHQITVLSIQKEIERLIMNYEPRAKLLSVKVRFQEDINTIQTSITFKILSNPQPLTFSMGLERLR